MRVLVTLNSDVLVDEESDGDGRQGYPWKIKGQDPTPTPWSGETATAFARGTGTETDPYMIETAEQLAYFAYSSNNSSERKAYSGKYIALGADIDLGGVKAADGTWSGRQWTVIGVGSSSYDPIFSGTFNGNGYSISNLYVSGVEYAGLFGTVKSGSVVKNVVLESGMIDALGYAGGIVASIYDLRRGLFDHK